VIGDSIAGVSGGAVAAGVGGRGSIAGVSDGAVASGVGGGGSSTGVSGGVVASGVGGGFLFARRHGAAALVSGCAGVVGISVLATVADGAVGLGRSGLLAGRLFAAVASAAAGCCCAVAGALVATVVSAAAGCCAVAGGVIAAGTRGVGAGAAGCTLAASDVLGCAG
jgi:hypothetical protein